MLSIAINSAKISSRPTTKIIMQKIFPMFQFLKSVARHKIFSYQLLLRRRILMPATAINSAKISSRPTTKITMQKIFPKFDKALKLSGSQSPGKFPTVDRHATDIDTA